jgi:hemerythrin HHE cation binding domain-containing protein
MGLFQWTERYAAQVTDFDRQHQSLFRMVNELHESLGVGRGKDVVGKILQQLIEYTATHFAAEEAAMEKSGFPGRGGCGLMGEVLTGSGKRFAAEDKGEDSRAGFAAARSVYVPNPRHV